MSSIYLGADANIIPTNHTVFCRLITFFTSGRGGAAF